MMKRKKTILFGLTAVGLIHLLFGEVDIANADQLYLLFIGNQGISTSILTIRHTQGVAEGHDGWDASFLEAPTPALDIYSKVNFDPYKLMRDSRPPESMTTIIAEIRGRGLSSPVNATLEVITGDTLSEHIFDNKIIIGYLYDTSNNLLDSYNIKNMAELGQTISITVGNGLSYYLKVRFYDIEDLNRDRIVDFRDFAEFTEVYGTSGHSAEDIWADGADFDKSGDVGISDLSYFIEGWLLETNSVCGE